MHASSAAVSRLLACGADVCMRNSQRAGIMDLAGDRRPDDASRRHRSVHELCVCVCVCVCVSIRHRSTHEARIIPLLACKVTYNTAQTYKRLQIRRKVCWVCISVFVVCAS